MRFREVRQIAVSGAAVRLGLLACCVAGAALAQSSTRSTSPTITPLPAGTGVNSGAGMPSLTEDYEEPSSFRVMRQNAHRDDIKRRMEQNATRLLLLSAELRNELQTRALTEADGKRLDEIAKLAHAVREQMKQ